MSPERKKPLNDLSYATRANAQYLDQLYQQFQENPDAIDPDWARFFQGVEFGRQLPPLSLKGAPQAAPGAGISATLAQLEKELKVDALIAAYRDIGHYQADLDPLTPGGQRIPDLALPRFGLSDADLETRFFAGAKIGRVGWVVELRENRPAGNWPGGQAKLRRGGARAEFWPARGVV